MIFKEMAVEDVLKALAGHENILGPATKKQEELFKALSCPSCGGSVLPFLDTKGPLFRDGDPLPRYLARCNLCSFEFEPQSGMARP